MKKNATPPTPRPNSHAKWQHKKDECVKALLNNSVHAVCRAYEVPEHMVLHWRRTEGIPPYKGPKKPTPNVGDILS